MSENFTDAKVVMWRPDAILFRSVPHEDSKIGDNSKIHEKKINATYKTFPKLRAPSATEIEETNKKGVGDRDAFKVLTPGLPQNQYDDLFNEYLEQGKKYEKFEALPYVKEAIESLNAAGFINIVIGFRDPTTTQRALEESGFSNAIILTKSVDTSALGLNPEKKLYVVETEARVRRLPFPSVWHQLIAPYFDGIDLKKALLIGKETSDANFAEELEIPALRCVFAGGDEQKCSEVNFRYKAQSTQHLEGIIRSHFNRLEQKLTEEQNFAHSGPRLR